MAQPPNPTPNPFDQQRPIPGVKNILVVASGKGGVGKSTVSANLAIALGQTGLKVGLLDADIYGPSQPRMFGALNLKVNMTAEQRLLPHVRYGIKLMSIGFLIDDGMAVVWRGPMLFKAMNQFLFDIEWGELDVLVIDLPPGTGDVQLTLAQKVPVTGGLLVTTPQNVSLIDARKALDMFERVAVPIFGVIENMSYLEKDGQRIQLFPKGELDTFLQSKNLTKLVELPFYPELATASEMGIPLSEQNKQHPASQAFLQLANVVKQRLY